MERVPAFQPKIKEEPVTESLEKIEGPLKSIEEDKKNILGFNFVLDCILNGKITKRDELLLFVKPRFTESGDNAYVTDSSGRFVVFADRNITRKMIGEGIDKEQSQTLLQILEDNSRVLREKESVEGSILGFNFVLDCILNGKITKRDELLLFVKPRFTESGDNAYVTDSSGRFVVFADRNITRKMIGEGIDKEQSQTLLQILEDNSRVLREKESVEGSILGFNFVLDCILNGKITKRDELLLFVKPRFTESGDNAYVTDSSGRFVVFADRNITRKMIGEGIDKEQSQTLLQILDLATNPSFPEEVKQSLKTYVRTGDARTLDRLQIILANTKNEGLTSEINELIGTLLNTKRTSELKRDIYAGINANKPVVELSARLSEFEGKETSDLELAAEMQAAIAAKRKRDIISSASKSLLPQSRNVDKVITEASPLIASNRPGEREAGISLIKTAYEAEIASFKSEVQKLITGNVDLEMLRIYIDGLPLRPSVADVDYVKTVVDTRENAFKSAGEILKVKRIEAATRIREGFATQGVDLVLANIENFPMETDRDRAIKVQLLELYKSYVAANKPDIFDSNFAEEIRRREAEQMQAKFVSPELGNNRDAFKFIRERFEGSIGPLFEFLRTDEATSAKVNSFLKFDPKNSSMKSPRRQFEQRLRTFEKQREMTDIERDYIQSVERLSLINPYLVACAYSDPGVTSEFLRHHFESVSEKTTFNLKDGDYFPLLQIGLGPNGLAALGETVRNNPDLADAMLVLDAGKQPGGPFAIPEGAAWKLNSANKRGSGGRALPKKPDAAELKTVRSYGSPMRWYPGERGIDESIRQGSINTTVDYLVTPDDLSVARYPTNEELQIILSMQAAVLTKNVALQTRLIALEPNPDPHAKGDKLVTLEVNDSKGKRQVKITTDAMFAPTGLGESGYGFKLQGSRAEKVILDTKDTGGFPKISQTLEAFNAFAGRSNEQISPGETLVIYGGGNSADTLIEYVGSLFQGDNPSVRDITKLYLITENDLSSRPRYKLIEDLRGRNGRGNLIEQIRTKVGDIDFENKEGEPAKRKVVFYDRNNQFIKNEKGTVIKADSAIAATGFKSKLDSLLEDYAKKKSGKSEEDKEDLRTPLVLPTNEEVSVAETLKSDPSVLILGTASKPEFDSADKLAQLPREAREALLRNGAENAVAIGFRAPDTQAAVNIWLGSRDVNIDKREPANARKENITVRGEKDVKPGETFWLERVIDPDNIRIPNNIKDEIRFLSPLLAYSIGHSVELTNLDGSKFSGELDFMLTYNPDNQMLGLTFNKGNQPASEEIIGLVKSACMDKDFQKYALLALKKKRRNPKLDLVLSFKDGLLDPKKTFVQS